MIIFDQGGLLTSFLVQLSRCPCTITLHKPYIASLEIWMIRLWTDGLLGSCKLWTVGPFDYYNVTYQMDDYPSAINPAAFLFFLVSSLATISRLSRHIRIVTLKSGSHVRNNLNFSVSIVDT